MQMAAFSNNYACYFALHLLIMEINIFEYNYVTVQTWVREYYSYKCKWPWSEGAA